MKRIAAISLLALLLYNAFGYYLMFAYEREQERVAFLQNIPESSFQVLKFNVAIYTSVVNKDLEYVNEDMTIENKTYHIVKKKIENDTLHLFYLRNFKQEELRNNLNDIVESQTFINNTPTKSTPIKQLLKSFLKDYISNDIYVLVDCCPKITTKSKNVIAAPDAVLLSVYLSLCSPPPEVA